MKNIHEEITQQIIEALQTAEPFDLPWYQNSGLPTNAITDNTYQGINTVSLWVASRKKAYYSNLWATYKQWQSIGASVKRGEKASPIIIYKPLYDDNEISDEFTYQEPKKVLIKSAAVFNAEQVIGIDDAPISNDSIVQAIALQDADNFITNTKANITYHGDKAYYSPSTDTIVLPPKELFKATKTSTATENLYSTTFHELTHWTSHESRCNRDMTARFGTASYAMEELIAELGASFLCAQLNVSASPRQDHANYIKSWIKVLQDDNKALFFAAARASEATKYLNVLTS